MQLWSWLNRLTRATRPIHRRRRSLAVELLEDRTVPASIVVTTASDAVTHTGLSLRDAIVQANTDAAAGISDNITFAANLAGQTITLAQGALELKGHGGGTIAIDGAGQITLSGNGASGIFLVDANVTASLSGLGLVQGAAAAGGAIDNAGTLTVTGCTFTSNADIASKSGDNGGGAIFNKSGATLTVGHGTFSGNDASFGSGGGAIFNQGTATITAASFTSNLAGSGGALADAIGSTTTITDAQFTSNVAQNGGGLFLQGTDALADVTLAQNGASTGGAIDSTGMLSLTNVTLSDNTATFSGGGLYNSGAVTWTGGTITGNSASYEAGGIDNSSGINTSGNSSTTLTASGITVSGNTDSAHAGGIFNSQTMTLADDQVTGNTSAQGGGGVANQGTMTIEGSTISGNPGGGAGGIFNGEQNFFGSTGEALTVADSTIANNSADNSRVPKPFFVVGATILAGGIANASALTLTNSTVADNSANNAKGTAVNATGGGLANSGGLTVSDATIADNTAEGTTTTGLGGGIGSDSAQGFVMAIDSIIAANSGANPDVGGPLFAAGHGDLIGNGTGMTGISDGSRSNHVGTAASLIDPQLGPLAGGPTATLAPAATSPAVTNKGTFLASMTSSIGTTDTTFFVDDVAAIASTPGNYLIQIDSEQMLVTGVNTPQAGTITVERGYNGTTAAAHSFGFVFHPADQVGQPRGGSSSDLGAFEYQANTTVNAHTLTLGQTATGQLASISAIDDWAFSAGAGQQVRFQVQTDSGVLFDLTGPGGYSTFVNATGSSGLIDLPTTGTYTLAVHAAGAAGTRAYSYVIAPTPIAALAAPGSMSGTLSASSQAQMLTVTITSPTALNLALVDNNGADVNAVYVSLGTPPTPDHYQYRSSGLGANASVSLAATPGTYFVLVDAPQLAGSESYTLQATASAFLVTSVTPGRIAANQAALLQLSGFFPLAEQSGSYHVQFIAADGTMLPAAPVMLAVTNFGGAAQAASGSVTLSAALPANTLPPGEYSVRVTDNQGNAQTLAGALAAGTGSGQLQTHLLLPTGFAYDSADTIYVQYLNAGSAPLPAPLIAVTATKGSIAGGFLTLNSTLAGHSFDANSTPAGFSPTVQFLAGGAAGGVLEPGETAIVPVYYGGWLQSQWTAPGKTATLHFTVSPVYTTNSTTVPWSTFASSMEPSDINSAAWNALFPTLTAHLGSTWGQYIATLDNDATYLAGVGEPTNDTNQLLYFEMQKAGDAYTDLTPVSVTADSLPAPGLDLSFVQTFNESISGRYTTGMLGYGWTTNWNIALTTDAHGDVFIQDNGTTLLFTPNPDGSYQPEAGVHGTLVRAAGYQYIATDGSVLQFNLNGTLAYIQDANGNRIVTHYNTARQLTALIAVHGVTATGALALTYNAQGHLAKITDSAGNVETYGYDPTGQFLTTFTTSAGTTSYSYVTGQSAAQNNALATVTNPDNTEVFFTYDAQGRLIDTHGNGNLLDQTTTYLSPNGYVTTDALHHTITDYFTLTGAPAEVIDPLGNIVRSFYDSDANLIQRVDPLGQSTFYSYDGHGNLLSATDPLGNTVHYAYDAHNNVTGVTDGNGNTTHYAYDASNNLLAITYADNSKEQFSYNPVGEATQFITANGAKIGETYNSQGRLAAEIFADGTSYAFTYNAQGNLTTATDPTGTITFKYQDQANPNHYTEVDYSNGNYLRFTYGTDGKRISSVDQTGYTVHYAYDALGRLQELTDGNGHLIVKYTYNAAGALSEKDMGNGTRTVYAYDANDNILSITNYAPGGSINSFDDYSYDSVGGVLTDTNQDGTWTYRYDADGQLTQASFAPNNTDPDGLTTQSLLYSYDANGNRSSATINGVATAYSVNAINEYSSATTAGVATIYGYDGAGNLIAQSTGSSTTSYTFNDLNQLTAVSGPGVAASYAYDALGYLVARTVNGTTTNEEIDPLGQGNVVATYDGSGKLTAHYAYGIGLAETASAAGTAGYYDFNNVGSTVGISGAGGTYVNRYSYQPFGATTTLAASVPNPFTFIGQSGVLDDGTGFAMMRARDYNPATGQFVSNDPLSVGAGDANVRRYAGNRPTAAIDPSGLSSAFYGFSGGFVFSGTVGFTVNSNGDVFLTTGEGFTTGGVTVNSYSQSDATEGVSAETTVTFGHAAVGGTVHFPGGPGSPTGSVDVGFGVPGASWNVTTNGKIGNLGDLFRALTHRGNSQPPQKPPPGGNDKTPTPDPKTPTPSPQSNSQGGSGGGAPVSDNVFSAFVQWSNPADITYGTPLSGAQLNATANMGGTFVYSPAAGTVLDAGSGQTLSVTFFANDGEQVKAQVAINVKPAPVTINWNTPADIDYGTPLSGAQLNATATAIVNGAQVPVSGTFAYSPSAGTVLDSGLQFLSVHFTPDSKNYASADGYNIILVNQAQTQIWWDDPADIVYGTPLSADQLNALAYAFVGGNIVDVPGTFNYTPDFGTVLNAGDNQPLFVEFTPNDTTNYTTEIDVVFINVLQAETTVNWPPIADHITYGTPLSADQLNATAQAELGDGTVVNVPGTFDYTPPAGTVLTVGTYPLAVHFTPDDANNYTEADGDNSVSVDPATPNVKVTDPSGPYTGKPFKATAQVAGVDGIFGPTLEAVAPTVQYFQGAAPLGAPLSGPPVLPGTYTALAIFPGSPDYTNSSSSTSFTITPAQPVFTNSAGTQFMAGRNGTFTFNTASATAASVSESGALPAGLTFAQGSNGTATISGTPDAAIGTFLLNLTASSSGGSGSQVFALTVADPPAINSSSQATFTFGKSGSFPINASASVPAPIAFGLSGNVPAGISINSGTGGTAVLGGTAAPGSYTFGIVAANGPGSQTTQSFTLNVNQAPKISDPPIDFVVGQSGSFTVTATGFPTPALTQTGNLPTGVTFQDNGNGTGTLSGIPAAGSAGGNPYTFTIKATNSAGSFAQPFTLIALEPPTFSGSTVATFTAGRSGTFPITVTAVPAASFHVNGALPAGISLTTGTSGPTLAGTPRSGTGGSYNFSITASNGPGSQATQSFTLDVAQAPLISSAAAATFAANRPGSFTIRTSGYPGVTLTYSGTLPSGVSFTDNHNGTATLFGTPQLGTASTTPYTFTITANNGTKPDAAQPFRLTIDQPPVISSASSDTFTVGKAGSFTITPGPAVPAAVTVSETGRLPAGLSFVTNRNGTATLSGIPKPGSAGTYFLAFTAANGSTATQKFKLVVDQVPTFTSARTGAFAVGQPGSFTITTAGYPIATLSESGTLPAAITGISFNDNHNGTALLTATASAATAQPATLTITASNGTTGVTQLFTLSAVQLPVINTTSGTLAVGSAGTVTISTTPGQPATTTLGEIGTLPSGITFTDKHNGTALLSGTAKPGSGNIYNLTITARNGSAPASTQAFVLAVSEAPSITSAAAATLTMGQAGAFTITTRGFAQPTLSETGPLPANVSFTDKGNGTATLIGIPQSGTGGSYAITITATSGSTAVQQKFTLSVAPASHPAPTITSAKSATFTAGHSAGFTITTTGFPMPSLTAAGTLPGGVSFTDNGNGTATLAGIPQAGGLYTLAITARNGVSPAATQTFTLTVDAPIAFTSADHASFTASRPNTTTISLSGYPTASVTVSGTLPSGVTLTNKGNGIALLTGSPRAIGDYQFTLLASVGGVVRALQTFDLTVGS